MSYQFLPNLTKPNDAPDSAQTLLECCSIVVATMTATAPHIVFVIDDDARLRDDLVDYLVGDGYEAIGFASYEQFLPASRLIQPALVVLDLGLPGLDGLDVCPLLRSLWPELGVVMLTSRSGVEQQEAGMQAGADAYLSKTASLALVEATVASVLRRLQPALRTSAEQTTAGPGWTLLEDNLTIVSPQGAQTVLTVNEFSLVQALLQARGDSVPRAVLLNLIGKADTATNRRNLDATISRIRAKARASSHTDLPVRASYANGYAFAPGRTGDLEE
jgi:DNA-binding response OmpR family regulator